VIRAAAVLLAVLLAGCATLPMRGRTATAPTPLPSGRILVVARFPADENRPIAESAETLLLRSLRGVGEAVGSEQWLRHATAAGAWTPAARIVEVLRLGASPVAEDLAISLEQLGVNSVIVIDVPTFEQVWGRRAKFTRVAVEAEAFQLAQRVSTWRVRGAVEVEERRGRAFQYALEEAVRVIADGLGRQPGRTTLQEFQDIWRDLRR
jgi:hypothetical protein